MTTNLPKNTHDSAENKGFLRSFFSRKEKKKEVAEQYETELASTLSIKKTEDEKNGNIEKLFDQWRNMMLYKVFSSMRTALLKKDPTDVNNAIVKVLWVIQPLLLKLQRYEQKDSHDDVYLWVKDLCAQLQKIDVYLRKKRSSSYFKLEEFEEMNVMIEPFLVFGLSDMENVFRGTYAKNLFNREKNFTDQIEKFIVENSSVKISFDLPKQEDDNEKDQPVYIHVDHDGVEDVFFNQTAMNRFLENTIQEALQHLSPGDVLNVTISIQQPNIVLTLDAQGKKDENSTEMVSKPLYTIEKKMDFLDPIRVLEQAWAVVTHEPTQYNVVIPTVDPLDTTLHYEEFQKKKNHKN